MSNAEKKFYECIFIARQDVPAADVTKLTDSFAEIFETRDSSINKKEYWGLRSLAYEIKKNKKGHYVCLYVEANNESINEFDRNCKINGDILKHMVLQTPAISSDPSHMMQTPEKQSNN